MSKTVTIPGYMNPYVVTVNQKDYSYPAGETMEVPDEVAEVIEHDSALSLEPLPVPSGDSFEKALDEIIAIQESLIGGDGV